MRCVRTRRMKGRKHVAMSLPNSTIPPFLHPPFFPTHHMMLSYILTPFICGSPGPHHHLLASCVGRRLIMIHPSIRPATSRVHVHLFDIVRHRHHSWPLRDPSATPPFQPPSWFHATRHMPHATLTSYVP